jgi:hypothetical protein
MNAEEIEEVARQTLVRSNLMIMDLQASLIRVTYCLETLIAMLITATFAIAAAGRRTAQ